MFCLKFLLQLLKQVDRIVFSTCGVPTPEAWYWTLLEGLPSSKVNRAPHQKAVELSTWSRGQAYRWRQRSTTLKNLVDYEEWSAPRRRRVCQVDCCGDSSFSRKPVHEETFPLVSLTTRTKFLPKWQNVKPVGPVVYAYFKYGFLKIWSYDHSLIIYNMWYSY